MVTFFATISSSFARLPEQQLPPICYALVLGQQFWVSVFMGPGNRLNSRRMCRYIHVRTHMPVYANTFTRVSAHYDKYYCSNPFHNKSHALAFTRALANTCVSTHLPTKHSHTSHTNSLASVTSVGGGGSHVHTHMHTCKHKHTQTHKHSPVVCSERTLLTL